MAVTALPSEEKDLLRLLSLPSTFFWAFAEAAPAESAEEAEAEDAPDVAEVTDRYAAEKVEDHYL